MTDKPTPGAERQKQFEMSQNRIVWTTLLRREFIAFYGMEGLYPDLRAVGIEFRPRTGKFMLTAMTEKELDVFAAFMQRAVEAARPICRELDKRAQEEYKKGDDVHIRLYRSEPQLNSHGSARIPESPDDPGVQSADDSGIQE